MSGAGLSAAMLLWLVLLVLPNPGGSHHRTHSTNDFRRPIPPLHSPHHHHGATITTSLPASPIFVLLTTSSSPILLLQLVTSPPPCQPPCWHCTLQIPPKKTNNAVATHGHLWLRTSFDQRGVGGDHNHQAGQSAQRCSWEHRRAPPGLGVLCVGEKGTGAV